MIEFVLQGNHPEGAECHDDSPEQDRHADSGEASPAAAPLDRRLRRSSGTAAESLEGIARPDAYTIIGRIGWLPYPWAPDSFSSNWRVNTPLLARNLAGFRQRCPDADYAKP